MHDTKTNTQKIQYTTNQLFFPALPIYPYCWMKHEANKQFKILEECIVE